MKLLLALLTVLLLQQGAFAATGDQIDQNTYILQDAIAATDLGVWVETKKLRACTVQTSGITTATVQIYGSNAKTQPTAATDVIQIGSNVTADAMTSIAQPMRWMKAKVSAWTSGTITVILHGVQ